MKQSALESVMVATQMLTDSDRNKLIHWLKIEQTECERKGHQFKLIPAANSMFFGKQEPDVLFCSKCGKQFEVGAGQ